LAVKIARLWRKDCDRYVRFFAKQVAGRLGIEGEEKESLGVRREGENTERRV